MPETKPEEPIDLQSATLEELEAYRIAIDEKVKPLADERMRVIDEIAKRHQSFMRVRDAGAAGPHAVDALLRAKPQQSEDSAHGGTESK